MKAISFLLNDKPITILTEPSKRLLDVLRGDLNLTGSKEGCGEGECGACAVLIDHKIVNSCICPVGNVHGKSIITIEGFRMTKRYQVIEQAFLTTGAVQCGICTPGMVIATESLLHANPHPTEAEAKIALSGNLCRCTGYQAIVQAVLLAAKEGDGLW